MTECEYPLIPIYNIENISYLCDIHCEIGENEKCKSCNKDGNLCEDCNPGYYLPEDDLNKKVCEKCTVENCTKCDGNLISNNCTICKSPLIPIYNNEHISILCDTPCEIGVNPAMKLEINVKIVIQGYYLPYDSDKKKVKSVQLKNA